MSRIRLNESSHKTLSRYTSGMAKTGTTKASHSSDPKFAYTTAPSVLRKLLKEIPKRPKPPKVDENTLQSWGLPKGGNPLTAVRVLKKLGLLSTSGEPQEAYVEFMKQGTGPRALAARIKDHYRVLFENSHSPQTDSTDALKNLFNIHSGGGEATLDLQIQTFKALCEHADFTGAKPAAEGSDAGANDAGQSGSGGGGAPGLPPIKVDLHIHLPENKSTRDYEAIIQDIAKYIYGREQSRG